MCAGSPSGRHTACRSPIWGGPTTRTPPGAVSNDPRGAYDRGAAVVVIDAKTLERNLIWTEMDSLASSDSTRNLIIRPAKNFREGHTYIVALRDLKDKDGKTIPAQTAFAGYRDGSTQDARTAHME